MFAVIDPGQTQNYQRSPEQHVVVVRLLLSGCCRHNHKIWWLHDGHIFHTYARHILRYISSLNLGTIWIKYPNSRTKWASGKVSVRIAILDLRIVQGAHLFPFLGMPLWNSAPTNSPKASHVGSCRIRHAPLWPMDCQWCTNHMCENYGHHATFFEQAMKTNLDWYHGLWLS